MNVFALTAGRLGDDQAERTLVPTIDAVPLTELVAEYERSIGADVIGGYDGIVPSRFNFGQDLLAYYLGESADEFFRGGRIWVLGCTCGEVGCWPLGAVVHVAGSTVTWSQFGNEHRPDRDYSGFGPFGFDLDEYRTSVAAALRLGDPS